ncbi:MAG: hypothetical protein ACREA0_31100, partial [bacterium]
MSKKTRFQWAGCVAALWAAFILIACAEQVEIEPEDEGSQEAEPLAAPAGLTWAESAGTDARGGTWTVRSWTANGQLANELFLDGATVPGWRNNLEGNNQTTGSVFDGTFNPWRDRRGNIWFSAANYTNYRILLGSLAARPLAFLETESIFDSRRSAIGNNTNDWLMGFFSRGDRVDAVAHHEHYRNLWRGTPHLPDFPLGFQQWDSIDMLYGDGRRFIIAPGGSGGSGDDQYSAVPGYNPGGTFPLTGVSHPSNIVYEGGYYYVAADYRDGAHESILDRNGVILLRTRLLAGTWQFYNANGVWQSVS